jgi:hypothetical protein
LNSPELVAQREGFMTHIDRRSFVAVAIAALLTTAAAPSSAAATLMAGDLPATVTIGDRPLTGPGDHVAAFTRGKTLYVGLEELTRVVTGSITKAGAVITVTSFRGAPDSKTAVFTIDSKEVTVGDKKVELDAPVVEAYGHRPYVPISFFGSSAVRTKVKESANHRTGSIILPPDF